MSVASRRRPGRPARLSRDAIVEAALGLLDREPDESLTAARVAAAVDAVPAALYRHFESIDDLFDEVLARVLGDIDVDPPRDTPWEHQLAGWMRSVRSQLLRYPALGPLIGRLGRTSPAWLEVSSVPVEILRRAAVDENRIAAAHLWICELTIALAIQEATLSLDDQLRGARVSLELVSGRSRARLAPLVRGLEGLEGEAFFTFVIDRTIDGVRRLILPQQQRSARGSPSVGARRRPRGG